VRLLLATRRDLDNEVQAGRFRDDLFHRIAVARIELPPLRARSGDVELLACHFCSVFGADPAQLPDELLELWADSPWPGNIRELRNAVLRWLAVGDLGEGARSEARPDLPRARTGPALEGDTIARIIALDLPLAEARQRISDEFERRFVEHLLAQHGGNVTRAAAAAGIARRHLHRLMSKSG
jgi:DNA-binding NtrC family response regulator